MGIIVGNTGAGKTTYCQDLKAKNKGVIFSIDEWNATLFLPDKTDKDGLDWFLERIERNESMIQSLVIQLENASTDSILDLGFSKKAHRDKFRDFAVSKGFDFKLHFLDVPKETRWERVQKRNADKGATFQFEVSKENFDFMETWFETPDSVELENGIIVAK